MTSRRRITAIALSNTGVAATSNLPARRRWVAPFDRSNSTGRCPVPHARLPSWRCITSDWERVLGSERCARWMARRAESWGSARQAMPQPLSGQSVEEATAVGGMASRRTVRVVEIAELLGVTQARAHQFAPMKARGDLGRPPNVRSVISALSTPYGRPKRQAGRRTCPQRRREPPGGCSEGSIASCGGMGRVHPVPPPFGRASEVRSDLRSFDAPSTADPSRIRFTERTRSTLGVTRSRPIGGGAKSGRRLLYEASVATRNAPGSYRLSAAEQLIGEAATRTRSRA